MDVHTARHDDHPSRVQARRARRNVFHHATVVDADVADLAVNTVGGIVDRTACNAQLAHATPRLARAASSSTSCAATASTDGEPVNDCRSGSGTSSVRSAVPAEWIPGTPVSIATTEPNGDSLARGPMTTRFETAVIPSATLDGINAASPRTSTVSMARLCNMARADPSCGR